MKFALVTLVTVGGFDVMLVLGTARSTVQVMLAGVGSMFFAGSIARTWKVWLPFAKPVYFFGLVQAANAAPFRLHWKALPAPVAVKLKLALALLVNDSGPDEIAVSGAMPPTFTEKARTAGVGSSLPA